jgi:hypothetical protein
MMAKIALPNLIDLTALYGSTNVRNGQTMCARVDVSFNNIESAIEFRNFVNEPHKFSFVGEKLFVDNYPYRRVLTDGKEIFNVELYLGFGVSNNGTRADNILNFIADNFELPPHFKIAYPDEENTELGKVPKWKNITLPMEQRSLLNLDLVPFLRIFSLNEEVKLIRSKFCTLLSVDEESIDVRAQSYDPSSITIFCATPELSKRLKKEIFDLAQQYNCDESFRFESIPAVAATSHANSFKLRANEDVVFKELLNKLFGPESITESLKISGPSSSGE